MRKGIWLDRAPVVAARVAATQKKRHGHTMEPCPASPHIEATGRRLHVVLCPVGGVWSGHTAKSVPVHSGHEGGRGASRRVLESRRRYCDGHPWKKKEKEREQETKK